MCVARAIGHALTRVWRAVSGRRATGDEHILRVEIRVDIHGDPATAFSRRAAGDGRVLHAHLSVNSRYRPTVPCNRMAVRDGGAREGKQGSITYRLDRAAV